MQGFIIAIRYLIIIGIGYFLKRIGLVNAAETKGLGKLILYLTLPAVIITGFAQSAYDSWMLISLLIGLGASSLILACVALVFRRQPKELRAFYALNCAGMNLGNITIPFLSSALPQSLTYAGMFATGDSIIALGGNYAVAEMVLQKRSGNPISRILKTLLSSPPFLAYAGMAILLVCGIRLPSAFTDFCSIVAGANTLLCMLFIGLSLNFSRGAVNVKAVVTVLAVRLTASVILFILAMVFLKGAPPLMRQAIAISVFSAIPNVCVIYVSRLDLDTASAGLLSTISAILAIPLLSIATYLSSIL